jgi:hypothetical protein
MKEHKNRSILILLLTAICATVFLTLACDDTPNGPEEPPPGRRDYVWTLDTIDYKYRLFNSIWVADTNDIWATVNPIDPGKCIWHYDGNMWKEWGEHPWITPGSIFGFSKNNIWVVGDEGRILHYDGQTWELVLKYQPEWKYLAFQDIWGSSENDIYTVGHYVNDKNQRIGLILHYNGVEWNKLEINEIEAQFLKFQQDRNGNKFIYGGKVDLTLPDSSMIFTLKDNNVERIYLGSLFTAEQAAIGNINGRTYFQFNYGIHTYNNGEFNKIEHLDHERAVYGFSGNSLHDLLFPTEEGILHYNGNTTEFIYHKPGFFIMDEIKFKDKIYAVGYDWDKNINFFLIGRPK